MKNAMNKGYKRIGIVVLAVALLLATVLPVFAKTTEKESKLIQTIACEVQDEIKGDEAVSVPQKVADQINAMIK